MIRPCMTVEEYAGWDAANARCGQPAPTPCVDCPAAFAASMRLVGRCNGVPGVPLRAETDSKRRRQWRESQRRRTIARRTISLQGRPATTLDRGRETEHFRPQPAA